MTVHTEPATDTVAAATQLLTFALDPSRRPSTDDGYRTLIDRYQSNGQFARTVRQAADGMGLSLLHSDDVLGLIVAARPGTPMATDASWFRSKVNIRGVEDRLLYGMVVAGVAAYCFPTKHSLTDPSTLPFHVTNIDEFVSTHTREVAAGEIALEDDLVGAWQVWDDRPQAEMTQQGNYKAHTRLRMIQQVCGLLVELGMLLPDREAADVFRPTDRFRHHLAAHAGTLAYHAIVHSPVVDTFIWPEGPPPGDGEPGSGIDVPAPAGTGDTTDVAAPDDVDDLEELA